MTMQDIVRERRTVERIRNLDRMDIVEIIHSDEDRIHALEVERDALREALKPMAKHYNELVKACSPEPLSDKVVAAIGLPFTLAELEAAAQAVEKEPECIQCHSLTGVGSATGARRCIYAEGHTQPHYYTNVPEPVEGREDDA